MAIHAITDRSITEHFREELDKAIQQGAADLVLNTTERRAGRVQGLLDAMSLLDSLIQRSNDEQRARQDRPN